MAPEKKDAAVADLAKLLEGALAHRGGLTGMALKTGLAMLKSGKPDVMQRGAARMLPEFAVQLQPLFERFQKDGGADFTAFLKKNAGETATVLARTIDQLMSTSQNATAKSLYGKFRGGADKDIAAMVPEVGRLVQKYLA
ncbi:hypothetical protein D0B54_10530 [Solimonas sp. K1W22B-7]|nr:hypothetical protein D0B54_10530 [Solimonas sp. K1W22B-7]